MALSFIFGASGAGKSTKLYDSLLMQAKEHPEQNFYIIVPDQFTMQTQKDMVMRSPEHGIMNIDVLSFGRLSFRVLEETGGADAPVLDDTGKNLILRIVADRKKEELGVLGAHLRKPGYIHEVKSAISEFMQYRIGQDELQEIIACASSRHALAGKLKDLSVLYGAFTEYIRDHYITTEESMEVLARQISQSEKLRASVVAFDGFTGFTPVQLSVIEQLLGTAQQVIFTMTIDDREDPFLEDGEQKLFHLTKKTVRQLCKCAERASVPYETFVETALKEKETASKEKQAASCVKRFAAQPVLAHLERNLFRYPQQPYEEEPRGIGLAELSNPREEARFCAREIHRLIRENGYYFRDFAVVCGNLEGYAPHIRSEFAKMNLPCFIDQTSGIMLNPFVEFIRSALMLGVQDFSIDSVNHFMRSGLTDFPVERIDELDNYIRATGIRGYSRWKRPFTKKMEAVSEKEAILLLERLNEIRLQFLEQTAVLREMGESASEKVRTLYDFIASQQVQEKLLHYEKQFEEKGDLVRAREYHQIYPYIIDLLSQVDTLLGKEKLSEREFADLLDAGFSEMEVGAIPQNVDHIAVGDMERSRLKNIKILFFLGVNDGNIPKHADKGGIISDIDREFLQTTQWEFAPSPRQKMYIQRLYLYLNMTKPSEGLYLTYARTGSDGKTMRPAYLIDLLRKMFPHLLVMHPEEQDELERIETWEDGLKYLSDCLRLAACGQLEARKLDDVAMTLQLYTDEKKGLNFAENHQEQTHKLFQAAFTRYLEIPLPERLAASLYGQKMRGSVTRLEKYAACAYAHFLQYGLQLREREEFSFEPVDMGTLFHGILADFSERLSQNGYTWINFPEEIGKKLLEESSEKCAAAYGNAILYDTARSRYTLIRVKRIMERTIFTLQYQLQQGEFEPEQFELPFELEEEAGRMELIGRIDRLDGAEQGDAARLVKVLDYKSGQNQFDMTAFHHGLQLQLMTYLHAAMEQEKSNFPKADIIPAGVLYYHLDDPVIELESELSPEEIQEELLLAQRVSGLVNADDAVIRKIDHTPGTTLKVLPFTRKADGSLRENAMLTTQEDMTLLTGYAMHEIKRFTNEILQGCIQMKPYERKSSGACTYCAYAKVCGFDSKIPGYEKNVLAEEDREAVLQDIREIMENEKK